MTLKELVAEFASGVVAQTDAIWRGDARSGNRHAERSITAWKMLRAQGDAGRDALAALLTDPSMDIRTAAAAFLLRYRHAESRAVLEEAAKGKGLIPFEAQQTLERWNEGTWALDPE
jgi:hypothetical protein